MEAVAFLPTWERSLTVHLPGSKNDTLGWTSCGIQHDYYLATHHQIAQQCSILGEVRGASGYSWSLMCCDYILLWQAVLAVIIY